MKSRSDTFWWLTYPTTLPPGEEVDTEYERIECPGNKLHARTGKRITELSVLIHPLAVRDFIWTWFSDIVVLQRVLDIFQREHVSGYGIRPARISYPRKVEVAPPEMFELIVTGWGGLAAPAAKMTLVKSCDDCGHKTYAIAEPSRLIDRTALDGSDMFFVWPLPKYIFISDRLANILERERITGVNLIPAEQIPMERGGGASPGNLKNWMPEQRARELERRLGI